MPIQTSGAVNLGQRQGGFVAGPSPTIATNLDASQKAKLAHEAETQDISRDRSTMDRMIQLWPAMHGKTGPSADAEVTASKLLHRAGTPGLATWSPEEVAAKDEFDKLQAQMSGRLGTRSDSALQNAAASIPNTHMSEGGGRAALAQVAAQVDMANLKRQEWNKYRSDPANAGKIANDPEAFKTWENKFSRSLDQRAFEFNRMMPEDRKTFIKQLPKDQREKFLDKMDTADKAGWFK